MKVSRLPHLLKGVRRRLALSLKRRGLGAGPKEGPMMGAPEPADTWLDPHLFTGTNTVGDQHDWLQDDPEEVDRLVRLTFNALLRQEPGEQVLAAYREGFARGTTVHGLIDDVLESDEYRAARERALRLRSLQSASADESLEPVRIEEIKAAVQLLEARLVEKGCILAPAVSANSNRSPDVANRNRMRSLRLTLSMLDRR